MSSTKKDVSPNLLDLFDSKENLTFCTYKELGLLCFDGHHLALVSVLPPQSGHSTPVFVKTSTISFDQLPPGATEILELTVSENGRFVALIGERCVYVVELSGDLWSNQSLFASVTLSNLRPNYIAKCDILNVNLVLSKRSGSIRKVTWLNSLIAPESSSILAVLHSNSVVRIYDLNVSKSAPIAIADFQRVLMAHELDESYKSTDGKHLGLITEIVSFDFGPVLEHNNNAYYTIFAVDSDGEIYYNVCSTKAENFCSPIGPLKLEGMGPSNKSFYFNSTEIFYVPHSGAHDLHVFAFCSEQGELFHVLLNQTDPLETLFETNKNIYRLNVMDSMQIEDWPANNLNVALRNNPDTEGEYFVVSSTEVYLVNPMTWINQLDLLMDKPNTNNIDFPVSDIRHFFKILGVGIKTTTIAAIASLRIEDNDENEALNNLSLFAVLDTTPRVSANFIQRRLASNTNALKPPVDRKLQQFTAKARLNLNAPSFSPIPKVSTADLDHLQRLKLMAKVLQTINDQTRQLHPRVLDARQKTELMVQRYNAMDQFYEQYCDRLLKNFEALHKNKNDLAKLRETLPRIEDRYNTVVSMVQNRVYAPTQKEDDAAEKLRTILLRTDKLNEKIRDFNLKMIASREQTRAKPFQPSASAQKFMLTKSSVEISKLNEHIDKLKHDFLKLLI